MLTSKPASKSELLMLSHTVAFTNKIFQGIYDFRCVRYERVIFDNYVAIKAWAGNTFFDHISVCRIVSFYTFILDLR